MAELLKKKINVFDVEADENGNVRIAAKKMSILASVFFAAVAVVSFVYYLREDDTDWQFALAILTLFGIVCSVLYFRLWLRPQMVYVSREKNQIEIRGKERIIVKAEEILQLRYFHTAIEKTMTGSVTGFGPKHHVQYIVADLKNGEDLILLNLKAHYDGLSHTEEEKDDAEEIANIICDVLRTHIVYVKD